MCRFAVYVSPQKPILLADLLTRPKHSIVKQSYCSKERTVEWEIPAAINADGFGVAWYPVKPNNINTTNQTDIDLEESCLFRSVLPAWNDMNLHRISAKIGSSLIFAHVRAASPGSGVSQTNCHPFVSGKYTFMHNGGISCFAKMKKDIVMQISSELYRGIGGGTDSEHAFALFLSHLPTTPSRKSKRISGSSSSTYLEPQVLLQTLKRTIANILYLQKTLKLYGDSNLNFAVSDGQTTLVSRVYLSHKVNDNEESKEQEQNEKRNERKGGRYTDLSKGASLYFSCGSMWAKCSDNEYRMRHTNMNEDVVIIASERLSMCHEDWVEVPKNHIVLVSAKTNVLLFPMNLEKELEKFEADIKSAEKKKSKQ